MGLTSKVISPGPVFEPKGNPADLPGYQPKGKRPRCVFCAKEMRVVMVGRTPTGRPRVTQYRRDAVEVRYGYEGNGVFCTVSCGYAFGMHAYKCGFRE